MKKITLKTYKRDLPTAFRGSSQILKGKLPKPKLPVYIVNTHTPTTLSKNVNKHTNKSC